jgi:hypothetical protein
MRKTIGTIGAMLTIGAVAATVASPVVAGFHSFAWRAVTFYLIPY